VSRRSIGLRGLTVTGAVFVGGCTANPGDSGEGQTTGAWNASHRTGSDAGPTLAGVCATPGSVATCGQVDRVSGGYVTCTTGHMTCAEGVWGPCLGDRITTKLAPTTGALRISDFGTQVDCVNDPCDPACVQVVDTPQGLDAGAESGFQITEGGLTPAPIVTSDAGVVCTGLTVNPPTLNVSVVGLNPIVTTPSSPVLSAAYVPLPCFSGLANASWSVNQPGLAAISGGALSLVSAVAGPIVVSAYSAGLQASATVNVITNVVDASQVTPAVAMLFTGGGTLPDNLQFLYPYANTVFPRSVAAPVVQWNNEGVAATAVKVTVQYPPTGTPTYSVSEIIPESNPPQATLSQDGWSFLDQTAAGKDALLSIQRLVNGVLLQPVTETVHFATAPLRGNIFYTEYNVPAWTATIKSANPSGTTPATVAMANAGCNPCHSVSANGTTLVSSNWGNNDTSVARVNSDGSLTGLANMWNTATGADSRGFAYSAISADGLYALQGSNWWGNTLQPGQGGSVSKPHGNGSGLTGAYFANASLSGAPAYTRSDPVIDFGWAATSPGGSIAAGSSYAVSWTGSVQAIFTEAYTFEIESSDGATLTVNGQSLVNQFGTQTDTKLSGTIAMTAGAKVPIALTYKNVSNTSQIHLRWSSAHQPYQIIPVTQLYPAGLTAPANGLTGTYYSNIDFTGTATTEFDPGVNYNWNGGPPVAGGAGTNFSVEWTGQAQTPCTGNYQWCVVGDDGVRLWVDGTLVDDGWVAQGPTLYCSPAVSETAGTLHDIKMDYFQAGGGSVAQLEWNAACLGLGSPAVIPSADLFPTGDQGIGGFNMPFRTAGDRGNGAPYSIISVPQVVNASPVDVSSQTPNAWGLGTTAMMVPAFSPDGTKLVFVDGDTSGGASWRQGLSLFDFNETQRLFSNRRNVVNTTLAPTSTLPMFAGWSHQDIGTPGDPAYAGSAAVANGVYTVTAGGDDIWNSSDAFHFVYVPISGDFRLQARVTSLGYADYWSKAGVMLRSDLTSSAAQSTMLINAGALTGFQWRSSNGASSSWTQGPGAGFPYWVRLTRAAGIVSGDVSPDGVNWTNVGSTQPAIPNAAYVGLAVTAHNNATSTTATFDNVAFAAAASNNVVRWPAFEGDSRSVIFQTNPPGQDDMATYPQYGGMLPSGYSSIPGQLWSVDTSNPTLHPPASLDKINVGLGGVDVNRSYQPTVLPTSAGGYRWTVFTSDRQYGNTMNVPVSGVTPTTQLWVGAIDDIVSGTTDRSHPPFWLPNQVLGSSGGRIRNERAYWVLNACKPTLASTQPPQPMTPAFSPMDQDIGTPGDPAYAGSAAVANGVYTVTAGGDDIWNSSDAFHFVYVPISGDFRFQARVTSLGYADYWSKAGVMLRSDLTSSAAQSTMLINAGALTGFQWRSSNGASSSWTQGPGAGFPYWVRLTRAAGIVSGDVSPDGVNWTNVGSIQPTIPNAAYVGLAVTAHNNATSTKATFDNVSFGATVPPNPLPASACLDDNDCCGAQTAPPTAACEVDVPLATPVTRHCVPLGSNSCVALGGSCASDADCCGFPTNRCTKGACAVPPAPFSYTDLVFTRDYLASCPSQEQPVWRFFDWETVTPGNSAIRFAVATAGASAALPSTIGAPGVVSIGTASGAPITLWTGADVGAALKAAGQPTSLPYLRVFMDFQPTSDQSQGPTLTAWRQQFDCGASE